jgi:hypothetical protein
MIAKAAGQTRTGEMAARLERKGLGWKTITPQAIYESDCVIWAAPSMLLPYVMEKPPQLKPVYSPWLTANLTLDRLPEQRGAPTAWDNVIFRSPALGYVVATHQSLRTRIDKTVWTYYWALASGAPAENRRALLERPWEYWKEAILTDLMQAHPDIRDCVSRIDIMRMGHAMVRPTPGYLFSEARKQACSMQGSLLLANSDLSGISIFEEAYYRGTAAARKALTRLGGAR